MSVHLLDANVLIALVVADYEHHPRASAWVGDAEQVAVSPVVEGALVRFLIRAGESAATATAVLGAVYASPTCVVWPDSLSFVDVDLTRFRGRRQVTDAHLVGLAATRGARLATFDEALARTFPESVDLVP